MFKSLVFLLLGAFAAFSQERQATLVISVSADSKPLDKANVTANGTTATTDEAGLARIPTTLGELKVTVTKDGFLPASTSVTVDEVRDWPITFELQPEETVKEEVTVYATRTDTRIQDSPTRVEVLGREEIEEKMLMTPGDIVMMLNEMGGMRVQTTSPSLGAASIRIQGMRGRYTRILSDGLPLFGQQGAGLGLLQIPPMDLGQVEVIKGVASAMYGAGAMGGVVNLVARRPEDEPVHEVLINRTSLGGTDLSLFAASKLSSHWGGSLLGGVNGQERRDLDDDNWADLAKYTRGVLRPRLFWDNGAGKSGFLTGGFTYEDREGGTMPGQVLSVTRAPYVEALDTRRFDLGGSYQTTIKERYVVTARFAGSLQNHVHRFGDTLERDRHEMLFGEIALRGAYGRHTWVIGAAAERDAYRPKDVPRFAYVYVTPGIFLQDDITVTPWLSVSASGRADFNNQFGTFFSPRLSALVRFEGWTSRISAGQGFFAPTPLTEETEAAGLSRLTIPRPLMAERGRSASFDVTRELRHVSLTATLFASSVRNPIDVQRNTRYELINLSQPTTNTGIELLGTWRMSPFTATASYTLVNSRELDSGQRVAVPLTPRHSFGIVGMWEREGKGRAGIELYYTGSQRLEQNPYRSLSRPYISLGFMAERKVGPIKLFINAENLTNVRQTRSDSLLRPSRGVDGRWTVDAWAPLDGRVINGGVRFGF